MNGDFVASKKITVIFCVFLFIIPCFFISGCSPKKSSAGNAAPEKSKLFDVSLITKLIQEDNIEDARAKLEEIKEEYNDSANVAAIRYFEEYFELLDEIASLSDKKSKTKLKDRREDIYSKAKDIFIGKDKLAFHKPKDKSQISVIPFDVVKRIYEMENQREEANDYVVKYFTELAECYEENVAGAALTKNDVIIFYKKEYFCYSRITKKSYGGVGFNTFVSGPSDERKNAAKRIVEDVDRIMEKYKSDKVFDECLDNFISIKEACIEIENATWKTDKIKGYREIEDISW